MNIALHRDRCVAAGQCTLIAGKVFDQDEEDGLVLLISENPPPEAEEAKVREAAYVCPAQAIELSD